jgi:DNA excision repair protein ERCC-2
LPELLHTVLQMAAIVGAEEPELISYVAGPKSPKGSGLGVLCVDPARRLQKRHETLGGIIAMSATLSPLPYYRDVLGFSRLHPKIVHAASPFPEEYRQVVIVPTVDTTYRLRDSYTVAIARIISDVVGLRPGNYVAYFPSFAFLAKVRQHLDLPADRVLVQLPDMPEGMRRKVMKRLRAAPGPTLLLAVMGGIFAEGIDLPGAALIGAIVVGPGLPAAGFERQLVQWYYDERGESGFAYAMLYPGMQRVIQSAGRVIRTMDDRGVIVLLGKRFADPHYAECLPDDWYRFDPRELITDDPVSRLAEFWAEEETQ